MKRTYSKKIKGEISAPTSKSMMQRYVAIATLLEKEVEILNPSLCDDGIASLDIAKSFGVKISHTPNSIITKPPLSYTDKINFNCNESGTSLRIFSAIAALLDIEATIDAHGTLLKRPMNMVKDALEAGGAKVTLCNNCAPLIVRGPLTKQIIELDGSQTSQVLSGLLIACCFRNTNSTTLEVKNLTSKPYIDMTIKALSEFGLKIESDSSYSTFNILGNQQKNLTHDKFSVNVEGDWSGASFPLVAGAIAGSITVNNLSLNSKQADKKILEALEKAGSFIVPSDNSVHVMKSNLNAFEFDATDCPDLFPPLVALASACNGVSKIKGSDRLIHKESNRADALIKEFAKINIKVENVNNYLLVAGSRASPGVINSHHDHRIAMALAIAALNCDSYIDIEDENCISKSYPNFFEDLESLYE